MHGPRCMGARGLTSQLVVRRSRKERGSKRQTGREIFVRLMPSLNMWEPTCTGARRRRQVGVGRVPRGSVSALGADHHVHDRAREFWHTLSIQVLIRISIRWMQISAAMREAQERETAPHALLSVCTESNNSFASFDA